MQTAARILVIGAGPAGTSAALAAKAQDPSANVVLVDSESCEPYEKPPLSKAVLTGKARAEDAPIAGPTGVESRGVRLERGGRCAGIDRAARSILLHDGRRLPYDALVLATGAVVRELPQLPQGTPRVHYLRNVGDAATLKNALAATRHLLVVGGGLIGLEAAASAAELGIAVTVVEVAPRILARVCYAEISDQVHAAHRQHGVQIHVGATVSAVELGASGVTVTLGSGQRIEADTVLVGTGARPDTALAESAGLATNDGIVVDAECRTSDPAIFAAGDVVRFPGPGGPVRLENWRHALDQGIVAGRNAAGARETYHTVPSFWSEQYDLYIQGVGWPGDGAVTITRPMNGNSALSFEVRDGRIVYALGINVQRDLAAVRRLIDRGVTVDAQALADPAQPLAAMLKRG